MTFETIRRHRVPLGLGLLLVAVWVLLGLTRTDAGRWLAVLDSPLGFLKPRLLEPGWHLAPPGFLRISLYPSEPVTLTFRAGERDAGPLVTREGVEVRADGTIRYRVDPDRALEVHRAVGPAYDRVLPLWVEQELRRAIGGSVYSDISGARIEDLRSGLGQALAERFRTSGLELLSCDVGSVRIRAAVLSARSPQRVSTGIKILLIGLDGADWNILDPLFEAGRLPHLARLARTGVRGRLHSITPMLSPVIWTSVATGVLPGRHGIIDFLATTGRDGERVPVTSTLRRTKAIWNILSENGLRVGVAGWWASFPAEHVNGFIVSDRVAYQLFGVRAGREQASEGKVHPPELAGLVASMTVAPETIGVGEVARYVRIPADTSSLPADQNKLIDDLKTLIAAGDTYAAISLALRERYHPDFQAVYLEGTDTVAHLFMRYAPPLLPGVTPLESTRFGRAVEEYYRHADEIVGRLVEAAGSDTAIIICSDHGFRTGENRPLTDSRIGFGQAADWHRKYGVIILGGAPFRARHELNEASVLDITPTVLAVLGLPVAEDMDGRPILEAFEPRFLEEHPIRYVPTYETGPVASSPAAAGESGAEAKQGDQSAPVDPRGDRDLKEKLQSLGYLSQNTANSHNNRGMLLLGQGKYDEAIAEFEQAVRASEDLKIARINIARALFKKRDFQGATAELNRFLTRQPHSKEAENLLGNVAMEQRQYVDAEAHFRKALQYEPNFTDARNSLGILFNKLGRIDDAMEAFQAVIAIDPEYAEAHNNVGIILKERGRVGEAIDSFKKAIAADPEFAGSYSNLALVLEQKGDLKGAEGQYRNALRRDPSNVQVRTNYGGLLYAMGRFEQARVELERAVAQDPRDASAHNNLGAVYGRLQRTADEIASYRKAIAVDSNYADVHHNLGLALVKKGDWEEGEGELKRSLSIDRRYAPAYLNLARSLMGRGRLDDAAELLATGIREVPGNADLHGMDGEVYLRLGRKDKAIAAFEQSLRLMPDQAELRTRLESLTAGSPSPAETPSPAGGKDGP
jgi:Tfp pilus assembly protein PilF/predicted AlkP superfamily phosphohydrolase/phosphomutase